MKNPITRFVIVAALSCALSAVATGFLTFKAVADDAAPLPTFTVEMSMQDSSNLHNICDFARMSPQVDLKMASVVTAYCTNLLDRLQSANEVQAKKAATPPKSDSTPFPPQPTKNVK